MSANKKNKNYCLHSTTKFGKFYSFFHIFYQTKRKSSWFKNENQLSYFFYIFYKNWLTKWGLQINLSTFLICLI